MSATHRGRSADASLIRRELNWQPARDFYIQCADEHGVHGLVNLYGIESPGLTSSIAIGEHVAALIAQAA